MYSPSILREEKIICGLKSGLYMCKMTEVGLHGPEWENNSEVVDRIYTEVVTDSCYSTNQILH